MITSSSASSSAQNDFVHKSEKSREQTKLSYFYLALSSEILWDQITGYNIGWSKFDRYFWRNIISFLNTRHQFGRIIITIGSCFSKPSKLTSVWGTKLKYWYRQQDPLWNPCSNLVLNSIKKDNFVDCSRLRRACNKLITVVAILDYLSLFHLKSFSFHPV